MVHEEAGGAEADRRAEADPDVGAAAGLQADPDGAVTVRPASGGCGSAVDLCLMPEAAGLRSSRIIAAPFSAIIMVGELVLPDVIVGITEASTTRSRSSPMHPQPLVDHRQRIAGAAHLRGADRMEDRGADVARGFHQARVVVAARRRPADIRPA